MRLLVRYAPPFRRWHEILGTRLVASGHAVRYEAAGRRAGRVMLAIERRLYGIVPAADRVVPPPAPASLDAEITIDLSGEDARPNGTTIVYEIAGHRGEAGLFAAARAGSAPAILVRVVAAGASRHLAAGRPAIEDPFVAARAYETILPRLVTLLVRAVAALAEPEAAPPGGLRRREPQGRSPTPLAFLGAGIRRKLATRFGPSRNRPDHWRIGLRRQGSDDCRLLPDGPDRFRADPFLFAEGDQLWLFAEDYPYGSGKGIITAQCVAHFDGDGSDSTRSPTFAEATPRLVLEEACHLSYPLVLRHGGVTYMLPEAASERRLTLYRADPFPTRWIPAATLLEGRFADATPVMHEGRWWLFAVGDDDGGSSWDQLHLFHAPDLLGPWTPHPDNPVLIDAGSARPAGRMWHEDGVLMRPAQDCRSGYGTGVRIYRVDRLDMGGFRQTLVRRYVAPGGIDALGLHTLNRAAGWEVFDLKVPHPAAGRGSLTAWLRGRS